MNKMIGKKYTLAGMKFEIIDEQGENWVIKLPNKKETGTISKETLVDALQTGKAEEISFDGY